MISLDPLNTAMKLRDEQKQLLTISMREAFKEWMTEDKVKKDSLKDILSCFDKISEYSVLKKITSKNLWEYTDYDVFKIIYYSLLEDNRLREADNITYKAFIVAGELYLRCLKEKTPLCTQLSTNLQESSVTAEPVSQDPVTPKEVIAWLITQPNAKGTLYLENVVRQYMNVLCSKLKLLEMPFTVKVRDVFSCLTPEELTLLWNTFKAAPNYVQVNNETSGMLSAGLSCLLRYLNYKSNLLKDKNKEESNIIQCLLKLKLEYVDERCSGGGLWIIGGRSLSDTILKLRSVGFHFHFKKGGGQNSGYRDAWWYKETDSTNIKEELTKQSTSVEASVLPSASQNDDLSLTEHSEQTWPLTCIINGLLIIPYNKTWSQLLLAITEHFISVSENSNTTKPLNRRYKIYQTAEEDIEVCSPLSDSITNCNPQTIVTMIWNLSQHYGVDLAEVDITYESKNGGGIQSIQVSFSPTFVASSFSQQLPQRSEETRKLATVLSSRFSNGYRITSPIELQRFKKFFTEVIGETLNISDEELRKRIVACGTTFEDKVYPVPAEAKMRIKALVDDYFADGAKAIFYQEFYAKNEKWLIEASVVSEKMLFVVLQQLFKLSFEPTYFGYVGASINSVVEEEILRVWGNEVLLTYSQLAKRLPYIPLERIKYVLGQNGDFIWNSEETFSHINRIIITDDEQEAIQSAAVQGCNAGGYISITNLPFGEIQERNHELSVTAVHNAVYRVCLSDMFDKKGKIVTRQGDAFDALTIMKEYCRTIDKCSLKDLLNYEKELTGEVHRWVPMEAGNTVLVRIDKETYAAERYVHFNTGLVDEAIKLVVKGDYLPLKSFTTFGAFPDCGQTWNLFLLESYCRRFSREFRFDTPSVNSRNAGAVIRKSCSMDYTELLVDAVTNAEVPLTESSVNRFLFEEGYIGKNKTSRVNDIIVQAKAIRERRN